MTAELVCLGADGGGLLEEGLKELLLCTLLVLRLKIVLPSVHSWLNLSSRKSSISYLEGVDAGNVEAKELLPLEFPMAAPEVSCTIEVRTKKAHLADTDQPSEGRIVNICIRPGATRGEQREWEKFTACLPQGLS
jgi:hypothetical protein